MGANTPIEALATAYCDATMLVKPRDVLLVVADELDDDHVVPAPGAAPATYIVTVDRSNLLPIFVDREITIVSPR